MNRNYDELISRNIGIFSYSDQNKIKNASISIAGVGGIGGLLAERLVRIGIGSLKISDPGFFERSNFNRQFCADMNSLNKNKAKEIYHALIAINNELHLTYDERGIHSQSDADNLVSDSDIVVDAMDYPLIKESIFLQRAARKNGIYYLFASAIAYGALVVIFEPQGMTLEEYNGLLKDMDLENVDIPCLPIEKIFPILPSYILDADNAYMLKEMIDGKRPPSVNSIGAGLSSIMLVNEIISIIVGRKPSILAPQYLHIDLIDKSITIK